VNYYDIYPSIFIIATNRHGVMCYYSNHGSFHGADEVICYTDKCNAKVFYAKDETEDFIKEQLPEWSRFSHFSVEIKGLELAARYPQLLLKILTLVCV